MGSWFDVAETFARCLSRYAIGADALGFREVVATFEDDDFPDGFAFEIEGAA